MISFGLSSASQFLLKHPDSGLWQGAGLNKIFIASLILLSMCTTGCAKDEDSPSTKLNFPVVDQTSVGITENQMGDVDGCSKVKASAITPWRTKISSNLLCAESKSRTGKISFVNIAARMGMLTSKDGVALDITTTRLDADVKRKFNLSGITINLISVKYNRVSLSIHDSSLLKQLAAIPEVRMIMPEYGARNRAGTGVRAIPQSYKLLHPETEK